MEKKCVERRKRCKNASVRRKNESKPDKNNDRGDIIVDEERDKSIVADIQHFKAKAYYKASNEQRYINTHQEKFDILEEMMEAEREDGR